ncbi:hypothetical protein COJ85_08975 [Bacillus sp. AFS076308]|uniref:hypothetical protein n=1 Tax=unclassified Bacillus (in: firmicutes) TaxID=185979 RepID=UPI000BF36BA0|nr:MULTISPECIES: hypothetical protein [unclassified Bacillus (in: firmicutes)]PFO05803.1 hypothetical protein COJ85_08975 [Bacillus sp. AFS076308]PGV54169.1 hypothetical protein COD92_05920 [Bacillus sp. AFS037270]
MNLQRYQRLQEIMATGDYYVDIDLGKVWSNKDQGKWLNPRIDSNDYHLVSLYLNGKEYQYRVHELTAYEMCGEELIGKTCNHLNGRAKDDNSSSNIKMATMKEQHKHAAETGLWGIKTDERHRPGAICLWDAGWSLDAIAVSTGVKKYTIRKYLKNDRFELQRKWLERKKVESK